MINDYFCAGSDLYAGFFNSRQWDITCSVRDEETQRMPITLKRKLKVVTIPTLLKVAREREVLQVPEMVDFHHFSSYD